MDRDSYVLSTKVGRVLNPVDAAPGQDVFLDLPQMDVVFDFSRDGVLRSFEESLKRLELDRVDVLLIHDPDDFHQQAVEEAFPALAELRSQGVIGAIGAGMNFCEPLAQFGREADFDCFLLAGRYTLLDHSGAGRPAAAVRGAGDEHHTRRAVQQRGAGVRPGPGYDLLLPEHAA